MPRLMPRLMKAGAAVNRSGRDRQAGFTLLEILVALVVFGFLFIGINQGARTGFALWNTQTRRIGQTEELDATARIVRSLLAGIPILPVAAADNAPPAIAITGEAARLAFVGDLPNGLGATQRADITLGLAAGRLVLGWAPHRHEQAGAPPVASTETELIHGVESLELAYFGIAAPGQPPTWHAQWTGPGLPLLIRVRLHFAKSDGRRWPDLIAAPQLSAS
jgi:general secretion pathway protein J